MKLIKRMFQRAREIEAGKPDQWEEDEVFVRNENGELAKLEVPDLGGEEDATHDQKTQ